ncbi:hypothetical protein GCM10010172_04180 [Paractinoplanes ferrugineus]|uniref:LamG-like jellyroll fold domain-containing protein n=1 Tax=Paractinoplanes ferrugineus TaxID=113564 RepID=A0A919J4H2_9ACTN|nr:hypothetical protein Afe05nite_56630 [Actinoplanes ferrugineus]
MAATAVLLLAAPAAATPPAGDSGLTGSGPQPPATPAQPSDLRQMESGPVLGDDAAAAMEAAATQAQSSGKEVVVSRLTTETQLVTAEPQGGFVYSGTPTPVRTKQSGKWVPIDTNLHRGSDGTLAPVATAYGSVRFSAGGAGPLATTSSGATSYAVTWPGKLPAPRVSGSTATYPEVLPGVDLVVSATTGGGFHEVLVVKTAQAARHKTLDALALRAATRHGRAPDGTTLTANPDTGMVLDTATPLMWDSTKAPAADRSDAAHPGAAARVAPVRMRASSTALSLIPDRTLLHAASTVFPLYIDPSPNWHSSSGGTPAFDEVKQGSPCNGASYYNNTGSAGNYGNLGVGYNGWSSCVGDEHAYYQWTIPAVLKTSNVTINTAQVNATETYSSYCTVTATVNLHWTGAIGSGTDWNNRPATNSGFSTSQSYGPASNPDSCPNADNVTHGFDVKTAFVKARTGSKFTVVLSQDSTEASKNRNAFKRFADNPALQVTFNRAPATPAATQLAAVSGTNNVGCDTAAPYPYMGKSIVTNTPVLSAKISDPDSDKLRATFKYWVDGTTTTYTLLSGDNLASGTTAKVSLPAAFISGLADGKIVDWQVTVTDGMATTAYPTWSCHFVAEPHAVLDPSIDANATYPDTDNGGGIGAAAGTTATFTLHNTGTAATKFVYNLDTPPPVTNTPASEVVAATSNAATVTVTPLAPGPHTLWVAVLDAAGDASATEGYNFEAASHAATTCASLAACFNNTAITADTAMAAGSADGNTSFSATDLANAGWTTGSKVNVNGAGFTLPAFGAGQADNVLAANQTVTYAYTVPARGPSSLEFLTTATNAQEQQPAEIDQNATTPYLAAGLAVAGTYCFDGENPEAYCPARGVITYTDGEIQPYVLNVPDWVAGPPSLAAVTLPHRNNISGTADTRTPKIYPFSVPLEAGKTIASVTLPDVSNKVGNGTEGLHIFAMAPRNTTTGTVEANGSAVSPAAAKSWTGAWASPTEFAYNYLTPAGTKFSNMTFRTAVKPSISGDTLRIRLDNALGVAPLTIGHATVALDGAAPPVATPSGAFHNLTFAGAATAKIPAGGMIYSDPLTFAVTANQWLLVSFSLTNAVASLPEHSWASDTDHIYTSAPGSGDHTTDTAATAFTGTGTHNGNFTNLLTNIDVTTAGTPTQAVLGDGLIDAFQPNTAPNGETGVRLSDDLLAAEPTTPGPYGTIAAGIQSNYLMTDNPQNYSGRSIGGPSALSRIDRDILSQPGVNTVVLDEGLEDILNGRNLDSLENSGYTQLLTALELNDINVIVLGVRPCDGYTGDGATTAAGATANDPCTAAVDADRVDLNTWLSSGGFGDTNPWTTPAQFFIDTDAAVGVPDTANGETKLDPNAAVATDHVNLTDAGYAALASAYLGPQDTWALNDADASDPDNVVVTAADSAPGSTNPYLVTNPLAGNNPATLIGGATWSSDATRGTVLTLNGTDAGASTAGPVLTTNGSYTVSAWVKLSSIAATATVAGQQGTANSAFALQYNKTYNAWTFIAPGSDTAAPATSPHVSAAAAPALNTWTHLVASYNAATHTMTLYVNGAPAGTAANTTAWNGAGTFDLGHSGAGSYLPGSISNVQAWNYTLTSQQVTALCKQIH